MLFIPKSLSRTDKQQASLVNICQGLDFLQDSEDLSNLIFARFHSFICHTTPPEIALNFYTNINM